VGVEGKTVTVGGTGRPTSERAGRRFDIFDGARIVTQPLEGFRSEREAWDWLHWRGVDEQCRFVVREVEHRG